MYLMITQANLKYLVELLTQFMETTLGIHIDCAKQVSRYVNGTFDRGVVAKELNPCLHGVKPTL